MKEKISEIIDVELSAISGIGNSDKSTVSITSDLGRAVIRNVALKYAAIEVEKRIVERMPSEEECVEWAKDETVEIDGGDNKRITFYLMVGAKWLRSRLTNPGANSSQKTEGGGE